MDKETKRTCAWVICGVIAFVAIFLTSVHFGGRCKCCICGTEKSGLTIITLHSRSMKLNVCDDCATEILTDAVDMPRKVRPNE